MVICPKCGRPVSGRARACGYCGESLVQDYFRSSGDPSGNLSSQDDGQPASAGGIAAATLFLLGALVLLAALIAQMVPLFQSDTEIFSLGISWWVRTILLAVFPVVLFIQQLLLRGRRESMASDAVWLFLSAFSLTLVLQAYLEYGTEGAFYGVELLPYLLSAGCTLVAVAGVTAILSFRKSG